MPAAPAALATLIHPPLLCLQVQRLDLSCLQSVREFAGAWRAARGVLPLWSVLAVILLILVGTGG